jgi:hypothetical protein
VIWALTVPLVVVAAYALLCLLIDTGKGSASRMPYLLLLLASAGILYVAWFHPVHIGFA